MWSRQEWAGAKPSALAARSMASRVPHPVTSRTSGLLTSTSGGGGSAELWSGVLWLFSAFLDRADGELARIGKMQSRRGHLYDYYTDVALNSGFFLAAGINLRYSWLGHWAILAGLVPIPAAGILFATLPL